MLMNVFEGILIPFVGTTLGSACVFFIRKTLSKLLQQVHLLYDMPERAARKSATLSSPRIPFTSYV